MTERGQRWIVLAVMLAALARGTFWAAALPTPSPIDEIQHYDYVRSLAVGDGIPVVGEDQLDAEVLGIAKQSPTLFFRSYPYPDDKDAPAWQGARPQYQGIQGPVYYAALTPFYWLGRSWGPLGSFYLVRFGSALLGALSIPAAWYLARRLAPERPWLWLLPPLVLATVNSVTAGTAAVGNDVVVLTGTAVAATLLLRGLERRSTRAALVAGGAAGLVLVGKTTGLALVPVLALLAAVPLVRWMRERFQEALRWTAAYTAAFVTPMTLWTAWNLRTYGAISAAEEAQKITGPLQVAYEPSLEMLTRHWFSMRRGFWAGQLNDVVATYGRSWEVVAVVLAVVGLAVALVRRDRIGWSIAWGAAAYLLTFLSVAGFFLLAFDESGVILGRYAWAAMVPLAIAIAFAIGLVGGPRWALALCLVVCTGLLLREVELTHRFVHIVYEAEISDPGLAPVVEQSWNDGYGSAEAIRIDVPCDAHVLDLGLERPPRSIVIKTEEGDRAGTLEWAEVAQFARYRLDEPVTGRVLIPVDTGVAISVPEREAAGSLVGGTGDPMLRVLCPVEDSRAVRFAQLYPTGHPPLTRWILYAWPVAWVVVGLIAAAVAGAAGLRRRPSSPDGDDTNPVRRR